MTAQTNHLPGATEQPVRRFQASAEGLRWAGVEMREYKPDGQTFEQITRQTLFPAQDELPVEWRYFEIGPGGHSTLERHRHVHAVLVLHGSGSVLVGNEISTVSAYDLVRVPSWTWHQFRAGNDTPLGFLCLVHAERDRPMLPSPEDLVELRANEAVRAFIRV